MLKLVTSNENKLVEFRRLGLENLQIQKGLDLPEVDSDGETVILYKALAAGKGCVVEDTALYVEGYDVGVNVRWLISDIKNYSGENARWEVLLGVNNGEEITIYRGEVFGMITDKYSADEKGFGFDNYFIPHGKDKTLYELELEGRKDAFSARKLAIESFLANEIVRTEKVATIPVWNGPMQHD